MRSFFYLRRCMKMNTYLISDILHRMPHASYTNIDNQSHKHVRQFTYVIILLNLCICCNRNNQPVNIDKQNLKNIFSTDVDCVL